jgi:DNA-binding beta-propeller fold protein YncE
VTLARQGFIPIPPGASSGFDHADVYDAGDAGQRIYVAHTGADRIDVLDCRTNSYLRALTDLPGVAGVLIDNRHHLLFSSDRGCARASIFRASDEDLLGQVAVGGHPNGLAYDPHRGYLFTFNLGDPPGVGCTASVIALDGMRVLSTIPLAGRPRWATYDGDTDQVFVNIQKPAEIAVINCETLKVDEAYAVPSEGPHGMGIVGDRLFCAADSQALVVLSRVSGAIIASLDLPGVPDVVMVDQGLAHVYVAIGDPGVISVFDADTLARLETVSTEPGAHTMGINPAEHTVYAFLPASSRAAVLVDVM